MTMYGRIRSLFSLALLTCFLGLGPGCAGATRKLAETIVPAFRAESGLVQTLADLDERVQTSATTREEVDAWRKKRDEMRVAIQAFHAALSTVGAILLGGK